MKIYSNIRYCKQHRNDELQTRPMINGSRLWALFNCYFHRTCDVDWIWDSNAKFGELISAVISHCVKPTVIFRHNLSFGFIFSAGMDAKANGSMDTKRCCINLVQNIYFGLKRKKVLLYWNSQWSNSEQCVHHSPVENGQIPDPANWGVADVVDYFKATGFEEQATAFQDQVGQSVLCVLCVSVSVSVYWCLMSTTYSSIRHTHAQCISTSINRGVGCGGVLPLDGWRNCKT